MKQQNCSCQLSVNMIAHIDKQEIVHTGTYNYVPPIQSMPKNN